MNKTTKIIVGVLFIGLIVYLLNDLGFINLGSLFGGGGNVLATLDQKTKDVSVKRAKELNWTEARGSEKLYDQDSVLTYEQSTALVTFLSGPQLDILENSLVVITAPKTPGGPLELMLGNGGYRLRLAENQKMKINGVAVSSKDKSEIEALVINNKPEAKVVKGSVDLPSGATANLGQAIPLEVAMALPLVPKRAATAAATPSASVAATSAPSPVAAATVAPSPTAMPVATASPVPTPTPSPTPKKHIAAATPSPTPKKKEKKMLKFKVIRDDNSGAAPTETPAN